MFDLAPQGLGSIRFLIPAVAFSLIFLEYAAARQAHRDSYDIGETAASLTIALVHNLLRFAEAAVLAAPFALVYQHGLLDFDQSSPIALIALFFLSEFTYYWQHRAAHRIAWLWASHSVHHSATRFNLSAAIRLSWTGNLSGNFLFLLPLVWLGFHPLAVLGMFGASLIYQFFVHADWTGRFGPLEWALNTPAHHRVHHASNKTCLDKNYGGVLIIFDRLFGTFAEAPAAETLRFGVLGAAPTNDVLRLNFGEWRRLFGRAVAAASFAEAAKILFGPPKASRRPNLQLTQ
jgi:sterol desaturase/sphingolipid hydroxylase (fatty acid hydroxylase superfamily)